jgi:hypothetical protein
MDEAMLQDMGVPSNVASILVDDGWLIRLSRGAYLLRGDKPTRDGTIAYMSRLIPGLHVGGKTALAWYGVRQFVPFKERVILWGQQRATFPEWVSDVMLYSYQATKLFDASMDYSIGLKPLPNGDPSVLVSIPERALLESVSSIGRGQSLEEVEFLIDCLRNLRTNILLEYLPHCTRRKIIRQVRNLGMKAMGSGFEWAKDVHQYLEQQAAVNA